MTNNYMNMRHILLLCLCLFAGIKTLAFDYIDEMDGIHYRLYGIGFDYIGEIDGIYYCLYGSGYAGVYTAIVTYKDTNYNSYSGKITIPSSVNYNNNTYNVRFIGERAFYGCSALTSITIPSSIESIGVNAFGDCSGLTSVTIPSSVKDMGYAFCGCSGLTSVTICSGVTSIGDNAFAGCSGLTSINIPNSVTIIGSDAFAGCTGLTSINIPNSVTNIGSSAFDGCSGLTSVTIGSGVTSIGGDAFAGCTGLTSVIIGSGVTSIGINAFAGCSGLISINIPNSVTSIGSYAFYGCSGLTSVTIGSGVTSIGELAFSGCLNITYLSLDCEYIRSWFEYKTKQNLRFLKLGGHVQRIGSEAFSFCPGISSITIGSGVTSIADDAFKGCHLAKDSLINNSSLTNNNHWGANLYDKETSDGVLLNDETVMKCRPWASSVSIPCGVTDIAGSAFYNCSCLTSLYIPNSLTIIGFWAFEGCSNLTSVNITDISAWYKIKFDDNPLRFAHHLFLNDQEITYLVIPNDVTRIPDIAFWGCNGLTSVNISNSVTRIGSSAFAGCIGLTSVTIPNSVTRVSYGAFMDCTSLTSVTIKNSVTRIETWAFKNCTGLKEIYSLSEETPGVSSDTFEGVDVGNVLLVVPENAVEKYKAHSIWGQFRIETPTAITSSINNTVEAAFYDIGGRVINKPQKGIKIVRYADGTTRKVLVK